ncbi:hypothetical protein KKB18_05195, partial [bacterium]|nr:hypothetical protein [bacterium]
FSQRRKMLKNTLQNIPGIELDMSEILNTLESLEISAKVRPEDLSIKQFIALSDNIIDRINQRSNFSTGVSQKHAIGDKE